MTATTAQKTDLGVIEFCLYGYADEDHPELFNVRIADERVGFQTPDGWLLRNDIGHGHTAKEALQDAIETLQFYGFTGRLRRIPFFSLGNGGTMGRELEPEEMDGEVWEG